MSSYEFKGKWITDSRFKDAVPRNVFHRQLQPISLPEDDRIDSHILFRKKFCLNDFSTAKIYITADDYYKLYINGQFVTQGPAAGYPNHYYYNEVDVSAYLQPGENIIAVHTSDYADYASHSIPDGKLSISGILLLGTLAGEECYMIKMCEEKDCVAYN
jgi:hypothetical protein